MSEGWSLGRRCCCVYLTKLRVVSVIAWHLTRHLAVLAACQERHMTERSTDSWSKLSVVDEYWYSGYNRQSICFRPDTLSPALPWQLADRCHRDRSAWTLPGSAASDFAMRRGNFRTTRVNSAAWVVPAFQLAAAAVLRHLLTFLCQTAGLTSDTSMFAARWSMSAMDWRHCQRYYSSPLDSLKSTATCTTREASFICCFS